MKIGFSGSRYGMTQPQKAGIIELLTSLTEHITETHYGDCVGADEEFMWIVVHLGIGGILHSHPATLNPTWDAKWKANTATRFPQLGIIEQPACPPMVRNRAIVRASDRIYAAPINAVPINGGTWRTISYAEDVRVPTRIVGPDGELIKR